MLTTEKLINGLDQLTAEGSIDSGWSTADELIVDWPEGDPLPSEKEISDAAARFDSQAERREALRQLPAQLMAEFQNLSIAAQAKWYRTGVKSGVREALAEGRIDIVKEIILGIETSTDEEALMKLKMLGMFPQD